MQTGNKVKAKRKKMHIYLTSYLVFLGVASVFLLFELWFIWVAIVAAGLIMLTSQYTKANPHKILTILVALNAVLDAFAIAIWAAFPATQWSIYQLGFLVVGAEATIAAILFVLTLFGLIKRQKWAPFLAIALTVTQRSFAIYVFFPSTAIAVTSIWSFLIIFFAYRDIKAKMG